VISHTVKCVYDLLLDDDSHPFHLQFPLAVSQLGQDLADPVTQVLHLLHRNSREGEAKASLRVLQNQLVYVATEWLINLKCENMYQRKWNGPQQLSYSTQPLAVKLSRS